MSTHTYDSVNRLKTLTRGANTSTFGYNGLGDRLTQNSVHYTLDLNAGLTQVLSDGTNTYLYGLGRIAEQQRSTNEFYLDDALGSVRQIANNSGAVTLVRNYDPFGKTSQTIGSGQTDFGYTGELTDPSGLIYLRARYYDAEFGRFLTKDSWLGDYHKPLSLNRWMYGYGNPVKYTDPSGYVPIDCQVNGFNNRNLTDWLAREMAVQSNDWPVWPGIGTLVTTSNWLLDSAIRQLTRAAWEKVSNGSDLTEEGKEWIARELVTGGGTRVVGYVWWKEMVKDGTRWDFKDQIASNPGKSIMLCDFESCGWYEYSMPGNIFYGYVGRVAGFTEAEIRAGAVYAQQTDPENNPETNDWKPWWSPIGLDQATDQAGITVGFQVYNITHGSSNTELVKNAFKTVFQQYKSSLDLASEPIAPYFVKYPIGPDGPDFPLGIFDGTNGIGFFGR